jgi:hypothetical protein
VDATLAPAVIQDARRRQRKRRRVALLVMLLLVVAGVGGYALFGRGGGSSSPPAAAPEATPVPRTPRPVSSSGRTTLTVVAFTASADSDSATQAFRGSIGLFHRPRTVADVIPRSLLAPIAPGMPSFAQSVSERGKLLVDQSREVDGPEVPIYFVPTSRGAICFRTADGSGGCAGGFLPTGIAWNLGNEGSYGVLIVGFAARGVAKVDLAYGSTRVPAHLVSGVFTVDRPFAFPGRMPKSFGRLVVHYRDGRPPASVKLG